MFRLRVPALTSLLFAAFAAAAQEQPQYTISPASGPAAGGTTVTIKGDFGAWPYTVLFGRVPAQSTTRVDSQTLVAVTPPHLPGPSDVRIFEYDIVLTTGRWFTFEGEVPAAAYERVLLPIFLPPVRGAFGSEFHTRLTMATEGGTASLFGLAPVCPPMTCVPLLEATIDDPYEIGWQDDAAFEYNGTPGRFLYIPQAQVDDLAMNLRVFDASRSAQNFGTEMPIVREREFTKDDILLVGIPTDPRFRSTLRIYARQAVTVLVTVSGRAPVQVALQPGGNTIFTPAFASFTDFPIGAEPVNVRIAQPVNPAPLDLREPVWAFVSVTNNDTQLITTITPKP